MIGDRIGRAGFNRSLSDNIEGDASLLVFCVGCQVFEKVGHGGNRDLGTLLFGLWRAWEREQCPGLETKITFSSV